MKSLSFHSLMMLSLLGLASCGEGSGKTEETKTTESSKMKSYQLSVSPFGGAVDSQKIMQCAITNPNGMSIKVLNYGGTLREVMVPNKDGEMGDVVLGFENMEGYLQKGVPYIGSLVGRYANRIAKGKFTLDGKEYTLAGNNNGNSLHGGNKGYDKVVWQMQPQPGDSSVVLTYHSKDGEEGYPGNMDISVTYTLTADNSIRIEYKATTDKACPVNLTNHAYFNLSAGLDSTVKEHELMIKAAGFTPVNDQLIPTGKIEPVAGGPMDFNTPKLIGRDIDKVAGGYDHNWVLSRSGTGLELIASLFHPKSGRFMEVFTTEPGIQFYSGNFLNGTLTGAKYGRSYIQHSGLCLETQHFPDSPNQPSFPSTVLKPGETYSQTTVYKFSVK